MSGIYIYNVDFLPYYYYSIISTIEESKIRDHIYDILERYRQKISEKNCFSLEDINSCSNDINKVINFLNLEVNFICCKLISYSFLIFKHDNFDIDACIEYIQSENIEHDEYVKDFIFLYDSWMFINNTDEIIKKLIKIDDHLEKYLFNIQVSEKYPLNQIVKENFDHWNIEFKNSFEAEMLKSLKLSAIHINLLTSFLKENKHFKTLNDNVIKAIERLNENLESEEYIDQKYYSENRILIKNSIIKINFNNISQKSLDEIIKILRDVDDLIEKYGDPNETNLSTQENIKKILKILKEVFQFSNFNNKTLNIIFERFYIILLRIVRIEDVNNKKSWVIHEILQALAGENLNELGLNPTRDGYVQGSYKIFTELADMRKRQLDTRFNKN